MPAVDFPVALVCPACGAHLATEAPCPCPARTRLEVWGGIPQTGRGRGYWGECPRETLQRVLSRLDEMHWSEALREEAESVRDHLLAPIGPDFLYALPWDNIRTVLDIGAGMGFLAAPMASFAKQVVALEPVPERALFLARRTQQDNLSNLHTLIASATALPFAPASFDLITLNGGYKYLGLGKQLPRFLATLSRLLKPDGYLYLGIETRYAPRWWFRRRDPSAQGFARFLPRSLARLCSKWKRMPFYGSPAGTGRERTLAYTAPQYERMVRRAGFQTVELSGCFPGYHQQAAIYPLKAYEPCVATRRIVEHSPTRLACLRRAITDSRLLYDKLEEEVIVFASKRRATEPLMRLSGDDDRTTTTQFSTDDKVFSLTFVGGQPVRIAKAGKTAPARCRLEKEYEFLQQAGLSPAGNLPIGLHRSTGKHQRNGLTFYEYEYTRGYLLNRLVSRESFDASAFGRMFSRFSEGYADLCDRMASTLPPARRGAGSLADLVDSLAGVDLQDRVIQNRVKEACQKVKARGWQTGHVHGDLALVNVIVPDSARMVIIDWEHASDAGLACLDLMHLLFDTWERTRWLPAAPRQTVLLKARRAIAHALGRMGRTADEFPLIEALFLPSQFRFWHGLAGGGADDLFRACRAGALTIPQAD